MTGLEFSNNAVRSDDLRLLIATLLSFVYIPASEDPSLEDQHSRGESVEHRRLAAHKQTGIMNAWAGIYYGQDAVCIEHAGLLGFLSSWRPPAH